jgi:hypothetical protein
VKEMRMKRAAIGVDESAQALRAVRLAELALAPLLDWNVVERKNGPGWTRSWQAVRPGTRTCDSVPRCLVIGRLIGCCSCVHALLRKADCPAAIVRLDRTGGS